MNHHNQFSLAGKVVVVTGATGVLGEAFSKAIAAAGARVAVMGRSKERAEKRVNDIIAAGGEAIAVLADVLDENDMRHAKEVILEKWGTIDGLVNGAGGNVAAAMINPDQNIFDARIENTRMAIDLNLYGTLIPTHIFGSVMAEKGKGSIVNISSLTAHAAITRGLGYTVAKTAIEGYTRWMASELGIRYNGGIRVNAIAPGVFLTEQNRDLLTNPDGSFTERTQKFLNKTPYRRLGNPEELTGTLIYLLSDASAFVSGEVILVDGGFTAFSGV